MVVLSTAFGIFQNLLLNAYGRDILLPKAGKYPSFQ